MSTCICFLITCNYNTKKLSCSKWSLTHQNKTTYSTTFYNICFHLHDFTTKWLSLMSIQRQTLSPSIDKIFYPFMFSFLLIQLFYVDYWIQNINLNMKKKILLILACYTCPCFHLNYREYFCYIKFEVSKDDIISMILYIPYNGYPHNPPNVVILAT